MKKLALLLLGCCIALTTWQVVPGQAGQVAAAKTQSYEAEAEALYNWGLFQGTEKGFELERGASRVEALVMLIRLLGKEEEALSGGGATSSHPFRDVPSWANAYVSYAYKHGLAQGIARDRFGATNPITASQYFTFILRALGYSDSAGDFKWDQAADKAAEIGIEAAAAIGIGDPQLVRGQLAQISYHALQASLKGNDETLFQKLEEEGAILPERSKNENPDASPGATQVIVPAEPYEPSNGRGEYVITGETIKKYFPQAAYFVNHSYGTQRSLSREQLDTIGLGHALYQVTGSSIDLRNQIPKTPLVLVPTGKNLYEIRVIFDAKGNFLAYTTWEDGRPKQKQWTMYTTIPKLLQDMHTKAVEQSRGAYAFSSEWFYTSQYSYDDYGFYYDEAGEKYTLSGMRYEEPVENVAPDAKLEKRIDVPTIRLDVNRLPEAARHFIKLSWVYTRGMSAVTEYGDLQRVLVWNRLSYALTELVLGDSSGYHEAYNPARGFSSLATSPGNGAGVSIMVLVDEQDRIVAYTHYTDDQRRKWNGG